MNIKMQKALKKKLSKQNIKRLFIDIETSPNVVFTWNVGRDLNITHDSILKERAIICICYKWEHESKVHSFEWSKGDDKQMVLDFVKILNTADEIVAHNGDHFDIKWLRTRALYHGVKSLPEFVSVDTLKISRKLFKFNSNRLDYIAKFFGFGGKLKTGYDLWKNIVLNNDENAMKKMVHYCKRDVLLLEKVYNKLSFYSKPKIHIGILKGKDDCSCPKCGSDSTISNGNRISATGAIKKRMQCSSCGIFFQTSLKAYLKK